MAAEKEALGYRRTAFEPRMSWIGRATSAIAFIRTATFNCVFDTVS
jgi:hypothetical protein